MINSFKNWLHVDHFSLDQVVDLVVTNSIIQTITPDFFIAESIGKPTDSLNILDFGCGVGRNIFAFSDKWNICGYDSPNMLIKAQEYCKVKFNKEFKNITLTSNWDELKINKFDCIYATLVFSIYLKRI